MGIEFKILSPTLASFNIFIMKGEIVMDKHIQNKPGDDVMIGTTLTGFTNDVRSYQ